MRYLRVGPAGSERPVALSDGRYYDLSGVTADIDGPFLAGGGIDTVRGLPETDIAGQRLGAPVAKPGVLLCIGLNYSDHAVESGAAIPEHPVIFYKAPNTIVGPNDEVLIPRGSTKTDWEVELAVVIGRRTRYLESPESALSHVAGYTVSNDVSERDFQLAVSGGQWSKGKSCETFNPLGPYLVTPDEIGDVQDLRLWSTVNDEPRQDSNTAKMIFGVAHAIWHLSQYTVLDPGDVITTGTPPGVALSGRFPYLADGDVMAVGVDGLGTQRCKVGQA